MARRGIMNTDTNKIDDSVFDRGMRAGYANLDMDLRDVVSNTLTADIPLAHRMGIDVQILRGTKWVVDISSRSISADLRAWANWYHHDRCIEINVPLKWKWELKQMLKARGDLFWTLTMRKHASFWGRAPSERYKMTDRLLPWAIRHEFGHAVDHQIGWTSKVSHLRSFGGWSDIGPTSMLEQIMVAEGFDKDQRDVLLDHGELTMALHSFFAVQNSKNRKALEATVSRDENKRLLKLVCDLIEAGAKQPWLTGNPVDHKGRVYSYAADYNKWYSFDLEAYERRISNYQFATPQEWFAEYYAARYGENTGNAMYEHLYKHMGFRRIKFADDIIDACIRNGALEATVEMPNHE